MRISPYGAGSVTTTAIFCSLFFVTGFFLPQPGGAALSLAVLLFLFFTLFFYRDPEREIPTEPGAVIAPADGKIVLKQSIDHPVTGDGSTLVSIFMSPFNVHVNRIPISGRVLNLNYVPGKYLMAFDHRSMTDNERMEITLETAAGTIWFCQVSGFVARRIVCDLKPGQEVTTGNLFGMIKLGSRVDIVLPPSVKVSASVGMKTVGGTTILGWIY
ncbi:phosphatidylserine decarboxylase related protein [Chlorobaculum parvum NCIB 8327]|uniref:Phosphatidylserine decarboxylase proenzyme n=1 Tax=Chlorobaculum parvum (strain DSM 263 / NCIMB 8327) TaxID=517417 RepID=PSD_CHLP8|nr:phosphatidylserine decarboxylase [Chlorobaculum parvum]B3QM38.1 RecName: Full=Phosphatidylserine decarboxylase proenzyme; Contains: RecName: Full=Phosphatidylserine decarboxylase alpha chain; Contains: RecName: Full=Phosphatidylserine decarboxylase beta chain [Chlorobaculum parvum NCIB 8327]ACF10991.1 phosphatidylserine decarboxylase related protein [Chlorobaculum parvum NCIB 8327]